MIYLAFFFGLFGGPTHSVSFMIINLNDYKVHDIRLQSADKKFDFTIKKIITDGTFVYTPFKTKLPREMSISWKNMDGKIYEKKIILELKNHKGKFEGDFLIKIKNENITIHALTFAESDKMSLAEKKKL